MNNTISYADTDRQLNGLTFTDIFCGAGGSSIGLTEAGFRLELAANHAKICIDSHSRNHPWAEHLLADVSNYDMRRMPRTDILWASPICTEMSPAGGQKRRRKAPGQGELELDGPVKKEDYVRTRATFHDVIRAAEVHRYRAIIVENVVEVASDWELFDWWVKGVELLGYRCQFVSVSSAHIGGEDNPHAPQWRDRLYLVFTAEGVRLPDVAPRPRAWCETCGEDTYAIQSWKKDVGRRKIGKYRQQYVYVCERSTCRHAQVEPYVAPAASAIDWSDLGHRIGDRAKPLAAKTVARIEAGLREFARPIVAQAAGNTFERYAGMRTVPADCAPLGAQTTTAEKALACPPVMLSVNHDGEGRAYPANDAPLPTRTVKIGDAIVCDPMIAPAGGTWRDRAESAGAPLGARVTRDNDGLVCPPFVAELRGGGSDVRPVDECLATITASGNVHGLTVPPGAFYVQNYGHTAPEHLVRSVADPLGVITAKCHQALVVPYYRTGKAKSAAAPLDTVVTRARFGLVEGGEIDDEVQRIAVEDCRFRMLKPREHLRAQRFGDNYEILGTQGQQTLQAGNAVSANVAHWLGSAVAAVLC